MKKISILLFCTTLIYCTKKENTVSTATTDSSLIKKNESQILTKDSLKVNTEVAKAEKKDTIIEESKISINEITNLPSDIDGCGCYYSKNKGKSDKGKFIYVDNGSNGYMNINGNLEAFEVHKSTENSTTLSNENYKINIKSKRVGDLEEGSVQKGTIKIDHINGDSQIIDFYGVCGC